MHTSELFSWENDGPWQACDNPDLALVIPNSAGIHPDTSDSFQESDGRSDAIKVSPERQPISVFFGYSAFVKIA